MPTHRTPYGIARIAEKYEKGIARLARETVAAVVGDEGVAQWSADVEPLGSGSWGTVWPLADERFILKITADPTEGPIVQTIMQEPNLHNHMAIVHYFALKKLPEKWTWRNKTHDIYVIVAERLQHMNQVPAPPYGTPERAQFYATTQRIHAQKVAAGRLVHELDLKRPQARVVDKLFEEWQSAVSHLNEGPMEDFIWQFFDATQMNDAPEAFGPATGGILADIHSQNVGKRVVDWTPFGLELSPSDYWVINDPGHSSLEHKPDIATLVPNPRITGVPRFTPTVGAEPWELSLAELNRFQDDGAAGGRRGGPPNREPIPPVGTWRADPVLQYVEQLQEVPIDEVAFTEDVNDPSIRESVARYVDYYRQGLEPLPGSVVPQTRNGEFVGLATLNRRRVLAAKLAGRKTFKAWVGGDKHPDVVHAAKEAGLMSRIKRNPHRGVSASPKDTISQRFNEILMNAPHGSFPHPIRLVIDEETALAGRPASTQRACAASDAGAIYIRPRLLDMPRENQLGVLLHELGHVALLQRGNENHTEREADTVATALFGFPIRYDVDDIQTTGPGTSPRPAHLDSRASARKSTRSKS